ncbi:MAG: hypothetical protein M0R03_10760 [Novosphingobium sp.]|nr:hypothetical protein [Novosphingobium sp.]
MRCHPAKVANLLIQRAITFFAVFPVFRVFRRRNLPFLSGVPVFREVFPVFREQPSYRQKLDMIRLFDSGVQSARAP